MQPQMNANERKWITGNVQRVRTNGSAEGGGSMEDLAISITLEAAELLEHFQWKSPGEYDDFLPE